MRYDLFFLLLFSILGLMNVDSDRSSFNFCSFLLNGIGVDRRTNVQMVCVCVCAFTFLDKFMCI